MEETKKEFSILICECFEDLLDEHDIRIPNEDREGDEDEACIYGSDWDYLLDRVGGYLNKFHDVIKEKEEEND